eukprot:CAMPEP_0184478146 /NCGR_PEP_ID=MMETSP0113_2-20130426/257_1 /TAXON_ID=91329 /ORGANISM="Norrisiella sphaerica, Strain BC52" /LENGTH=299 /DNA_ID=CAMNT_0026855835 /DNA_START=173 /DNA_END=1069 /DNA_ORIENTATION=-
MEVGSSTSIKAELKVLESNSQETIVKKLVREMLRSSFRRARRRTSDNFFASRLKAAQRDAARGDMRGIEELKQEETEHGTKAHRSDLENIWDYIDENRDGVLSKDENAKFLQAYQKVTIEISKESHKENFIYGARRGIAMIKGMTQEAKEIALKAAMEISELVPGFVEEWQTERLKKVGYFDKVWEAMNTGKKGKVYKEDFLDNFFFAIAKAFDAQKIESEMMRRLSPFIRGKFRQRVRELRRERSIPRAPGESMTPGPGGRVLDESKLAPNSDLIKTRRLSAKNVENLMYLSTSFEAW